MKVMKNMKAGMTGDRGSPGLKTGGSMFTRQTGGSIFPKKALHVLHDLHGSALSGGSRKVDDMADHVLSRRQALELGLAGATGLFVADRLGTRTWAAPGTAKSVIQIWMWGGPSHLDTFDPKPEAGYDYYGALGSPIKTNVPGIVISELLPLLAQ